MQASLMALKVPSVVYLWEDFTFGKRKWSVSARIGPLRDIGIARMIVYDGQVQVVGDFDAGAAEF